MKHFIYCCLFTAVFLFGYKAQGQAIYGLTTANQLFIIPDAGDPANISGLDDIVGLQAGQQLIAVDMQPGTGELYGLAYDPTLSEAQVYTVDVNNTPYIAVPVNVTPISLPLGNSLAGGFDFNPLNNNEIYITSSTGDIYILNAGDGSVTFSGGSIFYAQGDINASSTPEVSAVAFSNNFWGADDAVYFGYDVNNNALVQFDENVNATIHTVGLSGLSQNSGSGIGMDSYFDTSGFTDVLYVTASPSLSAAYNLLSLDPATGLATNIGVIGNGTLQIRDIAVDVDQSIPGTVMGQLITALTRNRRNLIFFDSRNPGIIRDVKEITGIDPGQKVVAIDYRPFDLDLYALGYNGSTMEYQVYRIDVLTGAATPVNLVPETMDLGIGNDIHVSFDFNPFTDRIHVIGGNGQSYHLSPSTGLVLTTDNPFTYAIADVNYGAMARIGTVAYTNSYFNASLSQRFGIDYASRALVSFSGNDLATLNTAAALNSILDTGMYTNGYMDIYYADGTNSNVGYLATNINSFQQSYLYAVDPLNGSTTMLGVIGPGIPVVDIAAQLTYTGATVITDNMVPLSADGLFLYPNPVINEASVLLPSIARQRVSVTILDFNGNILQSHVYKPGGNQVNLDLSGIPAGIYSLRVQEYGFPPESVKLVKQ